VVVLELLEELTLLVEELELLEELTLLVEELELLEELALLVEEVGLLEELTLLVDVVIEVDGLIEDELGAIELLLLHAARTSKVSMTKGSFFILL
jgi:hypothetical protein